MVKSLKFKKNSGKNQVLLAEYVLAFFFVVASNQIFPPNKATKV